MSFDKPVASGEPAIAIVVMSYRRADLIGETIDSLMAQSNLDRACAAVYLADDCSPDHTVEIAKRHWTSPLPLRMLAPSHNSGTWGNVNQAIARLAVDFDWVLLLHDDDLVKPHWAEEMRAAILAAPDDVGSICSSWDVLEPDGTITVGEDNPAREREHVRGTDDAVRRTLRIGCWWHFSGCAIRTSAFLDIGTFDPRYRQCGDEEWLPGAGVRSTSRARCWSTASMSAACRRNPCKCIRTCASGCGCCAASAACCQRRIPSGCMAGSCSTWRDGSRARPSRRNGPQASTRCR